VYVWKGEATVWVDGLSRHVESGQQILLLPHHRERFRFSVRGVTHHGWCELTHPSIPARVDQFIRNASQPVIEITARTTRLVTEALTLRGATDPISVEIRRRVIESILLEHIRGISTLARPPLQPALALSFPSVSRQEGRLHDAPGPVLQALQLMRDRFSEISSISEIASAAGYSPQHLARLFAQHVGSSPGDVLWQVRTDHAVELIRSTGLSLDEVASQSGFKTTSHLSRRVKERVGVPPRVLRRRERVD